MQNTAHKDRIWIGPPQGALRIVPLDALTVIFDRRSGQTHVVSSPVPEILDVLGDDRMSQADVLARLQVKFDLENSSDIAAALKARLQELAVLGLVEAAQ
jgi:PqqD family protein of HPr-rel-A system